MGRRTGKCISVVGGKLLTVFRWAKISKAMGGRRTARQVASRVQKYFEKLRRFGVEVGGGGTHDSGK